MIKLTGVLAVVVSCSMLGAVKSNRLRERLRTVCDIEQGLFGIKLMLEYNEATTAEMLHSFEKSDRLGFIAQLDSTFIDKQLSDGKQLDALHLSQGERDILYDALSALGTSDKATQLSMLEYNIGRIRTAKETLKSDCDTKCRLYSTLGVLGGVFISLLLV